MPSLTQYENPDTSLKPDNTGYAAAETAARRIGALSRQEAEAIGGGISTAGKAAGEILQAQDQQDSQKEISTGIPDLELFKAQHVSAYTDELKGADPNTIAQVAKKATEQLDEFGNSFIDKFQTKTGQDWATKAFAQYKGHFVAKTFADAAVAQGQAVVSNVQTAANAMIGAVVKDPSLLDHQLETVDHNIDALAGTYSNLTAEQKAHIEKLKDESKQQLAVSAIKSQMDINPQAGLNTLASGKYDKYLGAHAETLNKYADTASKMNRADQRAERQDARDALVDADRAKRDKIFAGLSVNDDGVVAYPPGFGNQILHDPSLLPETKGALINRFQHDIVFGRKDASAGDPEVFRDFTERMLAPPEDPKQLTEQEVVQAIGNQKLSFQQGGFLLNQLKTAAKDPATASILKQTLAEIQEGTNPRAFPTTEGAAANTRALTYFWQNYQRGLANGLAPQQLLDKNSKDYLFQGDKPFEVFKNVGPDATQHPANEHQKAAADAVDLAVNVTRLGRDEGPEAVNRMLASAGVKLDVTNSGWCAALVNATLAKAGLQGSGSQLASSFKNWGFPVPVEGVQKGDVFFTASGQQEGYTGHVGFATGKVRQGQKGTEIEVVSSHVRGGDHMEGGVEWRPAAELILRRAKPTLNTIMGAPASPGMMSRVRSFFSTTPRTAGSDQPDEE